MQAVMALVLNQLCCPAGCSIFETTPHLGFFLEFLGQLHRACGEYPPEEKAWVDGEVTDITTRVQ